MIRCGAPEPLARPGAHTVICRSSRGVPRWGLLAIAAALLVLTGGCPHVDVSPPLRDESFRDAHLKQVYAALLRRVAKGGPNHLHCRRLFFYAEPFAKSVGADVQAVRVAALLHDSTKESGSEEPIERFCSHGETGARYAQEVLERLGTSDAFRGRVTRSILEHMGPVGVSWQLHGRRFMSRFCRRDFPRPSSPEAQVLYDVDMLDLMTVDGIRKVVTLRQTNAEFRTESIVQSARTGRDSAWRSVREAGETLITPAARACGRLLAAHSRKFLDGVDWTAVHDVGAFAAATETWKSMHPLPACLPEVPPCGAPAAAALLGEREDCGLLGADPR
jgi:putative nucleotidyltransferase with HDIG domain